MALINKAINEMTLKIVYYGPGLCGKTTNLQYIHKKSNPQKRGKLLSIATESDRTLFFDLLPMEVGNVKGMKVRLQLYTVPGQVFYDATRRLVLKGADGVVFVADSQRAMRDANIESINNLKTNLKVNGLDPDKIPLVFQFNKRDLKEILTVEEMTEDIIFREGHKGFPACALSGKGVHETLKQIVTEVLRNITKGISHDLDDNVKKTEVIEEYVPDLPVEDEKLPEVIGQPEKVEQENLPAIDDSPFDSDVEEIEDTGEVADVEELSETAGVVTSTPVPEIGADIFDDQQVGVEADISSDSANQELESLEEFPEESAFENEPVEDFESAEEPSVVESGDAEVEGSDFKAGEILAELDALYEENRHSIGVLEQAVKEIKSQQEKIVSIMAKLDDLKK